MIPTAGGVSGFFTDLPRLVRQQPWPPVPEVILDYVQVFHQHPGFLPLLLVLLRLRLRLDDRLREAVGLGRRVVSPRLHQLVLCLCQLMATWNKASLLTSLNTTLPFLYISGSLL